MLRINVRCHVNKKLTVFFSWVKSTCEISFHPSPSHSYSEAASPKVHTIHSIASLAKHAFHPMYSKSPFELGLLRDRLRSGTKQIIRHLWNRNGCSYVTSYKTQGTTKTGTGNTNGDRQHSVIHSSKVLSWRMSSAVNQDGERTCHFFPPTWTCVFFL